MMKNVKFSSIIAIFCYVLFFPELSSGRGGENLDVVKLKNSVTIEGHIVVETAHTVNVENVGGMISILRDTIERIIPSSPGESSLVLGLQLLEKDKLERAEFYLKKAAVYPHWRKQSEEALQKIETIRQQYAEQRRATEKHEIERLIQRRGLQAGINELKRRYSDENDYWGSVRGRLHLLMARDRLDHYDLKTAERHLMLAEKYGVTKEQWETVREEIVAMRRKSLLYGEDQLASHAFRARNKRAKQRANSTGILSIAKEARKKGERIPPLEWLAFVEQYANENEIDPLLVWALIDTESSWRSKVVSSKGAQGLMQLMPPTAKELAVSDPFDPEQNIRGGTQYLRFLIEMFEDEDTALAAYYVGPGRVERYNGIPPAGRTYVKKVRSRHSALNERFRLNRNGRSPS